MDLDGRQVLVTGGAGFVGSHVTRECLDRGAEVTVVDNLFAGRRAQVPDGATFHEIDLRNRDEITTTLLEDAPDVVIHLAALHYIPYCNDNPEEAFDVNVMGTRNLLEAVQVRGDVDRVVYASTAAVYPPREQPHAVADDPGPMDVYGRTKLVGEDLLELFHERTGVPAASARLFNVYGPNETNPHLIPAILDQLDAGGDGPHRIELGNLSPARDFVYVGDVADALVALATDASDAYRTYNVGTGTAHTVREVVDRTSDALDAEIVVTQDEDRVRESDRPHLCADTSRIEAELGWTAETDLVEGLRRLVEAEDVAVAETVS